MNILFLCTGNACRSQMAEGWGRKLGRHGFRFRSAGLEAHGLDRRAVAVMAECGVDISRQDSKVITPEQLEDVDLVVTVCGHADESCPRLPPGVRRLHWPLPDPARATGTDEEILEVFREIRDGIRERVTSLVHDLAYAAHP